MAADLELLPVARQSVADGVHDQLRRAILDGDVAPGDALPGERDLAARFGVNRHAVRQALGRLAQSGLVTVSHGGATRVNDWRREAGLDVLLDLSLEPGLVRSALEMRISIGTDVARLAAERATQDTVARMQAHAAAMGDATDLEAANEHYAALWEALVDGSENVAYRLAFNSLVRALDREPDLRLELSRGELADRAGRQRLVRAVAAGDADAAGKAAARLLRRMLEAAS